MPYEKDGIKYPRCTQIISDCTNKGGGLTQWAANCCVEWIEGECEWTTYDENGNEGFIVTEEDLNKARFAYKTVSETALDVGSEVHNAIEKYLRDGDESYMDLEGQAFNAFCAFLEWKEENNFVHIEGERTVYGDRWAGTLDEYCKLNDKLYVIDFKTSKPKNKKTGKGIYPEMRYQVAAYRDAMEQPSAIEPFETIPCEGCGVLRLDKETGMPDWNDTSKTFESDLRVFNRMVDLYFERHPIVAKRFEHIMPF